MAKLLHIVMCLSLLAANVAAALPACDSEKSDLICMQSHLDQDESRQSVSVKGISSNVAETGSRVDVLRPECCSCDHPAVCLGCCHTHTFISPLLDASLVRQINFQISGNFGAKSLLSTQPEADINRPPIASTVV